MYATVADLRVEGVTEAKQQIETLLDRNLQLSNDVDQLKVRLLIESRYMAVNRRTGGVWRSASLPDVAVAGLEHIDSADR